LKIKLFYGWYIVAASVVLAFLYSSIFIYGFTAFINPIMATFGWSYAQVSLASSLRGLETGALNPLWGIAVDRWPAKKLMLLGMVITALGVFLLSRTSNLVTYYIGFMTLGLGSSLTTGMLPTTVIARWFRRGIGKANGIFAMGMGIGGVAVPLLVILVDKFSWQTTLMFTSFGFLVLGVSLSFVFRSRPQDYGMLPDGGATSAPTGPRPVLHYDFSTRVRDALKMRAFWHIGFLILLQFAIFGVVSTYTIPYFTSLGQDRATGGTVVMMYTLVSLAARIPLGMLADRFRKSYVIAVTMGMMGLGVVVLWFLDGSSPFWMIILFAVIYGLGVGGITPLRPPVLAEYFGTKNFGTIFGLASIFNTTAIVAAAPIAGWFFDTYGDYKSVLVVLVGFAVLGVISMLTIPSPVRARVTSSQAPLESTK
jgi:OFA family oxalate/formate antiporter-like MFS transporter